MTGSHDRTLKIWDLQHKACEWGGEGGKGGKMVGGEGGGGRGWQRGRVGWGGREGQTDRQARSK